MAIISDATKIDKSFKFVSGKGYTTANKGVDNEDAASGFIIGTSSIFSQDAAIPTTAPGASTSILTFYGDGTSGNARFRMIYDVSSPLNKAWYASTNGSNLTNMRATRVPNWVPPIFGNYTVRIFLTVGASTTNPYLQEIFFSDATSPLFDYKTGILTFESDPLAAYAGIPGGPPDGIQISGYVYTGPLLSQIFDGNGNFTGGLSDFGTSTSLAKFVNPNKSFEVSSPFSLGASWVTENTSFSNSINWYGCTQLSNGIIVMVGGTTSGTSPSISYSLGNGVWQQALVSGTTAKLIAVWASPDRRVYALDSLGKLVVSIDNARVWTVLPATPAIYNAIWGSATTDIYIGGPGGSIAHSTDGTNFSAQTNADTHNIASIWGSSSSDVYTVGAGGTILHSTGVGTWTPQTSGTANNLNGIFGFSSTEIYAVGDAGTILRSLGGGAWANYNSGIPNTVNLNAFFGISSGGKKRLYASGWSTTGNNYVVYVDFGNNSWVILNTFTGPHTQNFNICGGLNGVFGGLDSNRIAALHQFPILDVHGNSAFDGYLNVASGIAANSGDFNRLNLTIGVASETANKIFAPSATAFTILDVNAPDSGSAYLASRESSSLFSLNVGVSSLMTTEGSLRLGSPVGVNPSRGEIKTLSAVGMKILNYDTDLLIANQYGANGSTKGDVNITTQNGAVRITAAGAESPYPAGQIIFSPATGAYVLLATNTTASTFRTQSPLGNYNVWDGTGSFSNSGSITAGTSLSAGTSISAGTTVSGTIIRGTTGVVTGSLTSGSSSGNYKIEASGDINCWGGFNIYNDTGPIIANSSYIRAGSYITAAGPVYAQNGLSGSLRMDAAVTSTLTYHYGLWVTVGGGACHIAAWGWGFNPCVANSYYDAVCSTSARLAGVAGVLVYTDHDSLPSDRDTDAYWPGGSFGNEFMIMLEWHIKSGSPRGFTYGGRAAIY